MKIKIYRYLIGAKIGEGIDYKIVSSKNAINYKHLLYGDPVPRKPDFIIELPTTKSDLEKFLEKIRK